MGTTMNRSAYARLIAEDLEWLRQQERTLERDHIETIVEDSLRRYYPMMLFEVDGAGGTLRRLDLVPGAIIETPAPRLMLACACGFSTADLNEFCHHSSGHYRAALYHAGEADGEKGIGLHDDRRASTHSELGRQGGTRTGAGAPLDVGLGASGGQERRGGPHASSLGAEERGQDRLTREEPMAPDTEFVAPDREDVIGEVMRQHPEIDTRDEEGPHGRARILDYAIARLNAEHRENPIDGADKVDPWGRKARQRTDPSDPTTGVNLNTDGLTLLLAGGKRFEIIDVIDGGSGKPSWHNYGAFRQGDNGYWAPGLPVDDSRPKPGPVPRPEPKPEPPPAPTFVLDYGGMLALASSIGDVLGKKGSRYSGNYLAIGQVIAHLLYKVEREGYPVQAAIDNANRRARGEEAD